MQTLLEHWDDLELWLSGLSFFFQVILVMPAALVLSYLLARCTDRILSRLMVMMLSKFHPRISHHDHTP